MKKIFKTITILMMFVVLCPVLVNAKEYTISTTDIKVDIDDSTWKVFTRDNIKDNKQLEELGIKYEQLNKLFIDGNIYLDALKGLETKEYVELFVMKKTADKVKNLSNYSTSEVRKVAKALADKEKAKEYDVFETEYKYAYTYYEDSNKYIMDYYTIVNGDGYTIKLQKATEFTSEEKSEFKDTIRNISFDVNESLKEPKKASSPLQKAIIGGIIGGLSGAIYGIIRAIQNRKNK